MKPARFAYVRPDTLEEALACLRTGDGQARALAGGQSLLASMNQRAVRPAALVDLGRLAELRYLGSDGAGLRVGALTTHAQLERAWSLTGSGPADYAVVGEAARLIGSAPIRARGTIGGSIAHADPRAEWCVLAVALGAEVTLRGIGGARTVSAARFFTGAHRTVADWDELVTEIRFPRPAPAAAVAEFGPQAGQLPLVTAVASVTLDAGGLVTAAAIALGGVADRPVRVPAAERALLGGVPGTELFGHATRALADEIDPPSDEDAEAAYRVDLAVTCTARALRAACQAPPRHPWRASPIPPMTQETSHEY